MELGEQALDTLKMTDAAIAKRLGVSQRTVRRWREGGGMRPGQRREMARLLRDRMSEMHGVAIGLENSLG